MPLTSATPSSSREKRAAQIAQIAISGSIGAYAFGWLCCFEDAEAMAVFTLVAAGMGISAAIIGLSVHYYWACVPAVIQIGSWLTGAVIVKVYDLSPDEAQQPFIIAGAFVLVALVVVTFLAVRKAPRTPRSPWLCSECGYLLVGLDQPRCPECGQAFELPDTVPESDRPSETC
jgi:hypothetical protein